MQGLGLVHYEFRLVQEFSSRLNAAVGGKYPDAGPVGTRPEFVEDKNTMSSEQSRTRGIVNKMGWGKARSGVVSRRGRGPECTGW